MIERYSTTVMKSIWSDKEKFKRWLKIEGSVNDILQYYNIIPINKLSDMLLYILESDKDLVNLKNLAESYENDLNHDVVSFIFAVEDLCETDEIYKSNGRWIHYGMTSSDLKDTEFALVVNESLKIIQDDVDKLILILQGLKTKYKNVNIIGRTHGQYAAIVALSKMFYIFETSLAKFKTHWLCGKISGAVGDNKYISQQAENNILNNLGLTSEPVSSQVVSREGYSQVIYDLALLGATLEKMVLQIRLYQQSGIEEMFEPFGKNQTGSSAMPHKRNPIMSENIAGLARLLRGYVNPSLENVALWHQRDMTHSSVERVIFPDAFNIAHFMVERVAKIFAGLEINTDNINKHLAEVEEDSQFLMLKLIRDGMGRQEAYRKVQEKLK